MDQAQRIHQAHQSALLVATGVVDPALRALIHPTFGSGFMERIKPDAVRKFITEEGKSYSTPASAGSIASALRGYFRYRSTSGDHVHHLIGVVTFPANWQLAALPKALSNDEVERLLKSLGGAYPSARRSDAIVRCAVDLGLRSCEIAHLGLDDIDWRAGTITLKRTKSRREDVLPLPVATGQAIADYLKFERPQTSNHAVFVRHLAPRDQPVGPDLVRKAIRQAYARPTFARRREPR